MKSLEKEQESTGNNIQTGCQPGLWLFSYPYIKIPHIKGVFFEIRNFAAVVKCAKIFDSQLERGFK